MYMLDTNIIIFTIRHPRSACVQKLAQHIGRDVCISVVTYAELEYGIENSSDPVRNRQAMLKFLAGIPILPFDLDAAIQYGRILAALKKAHKDKQNQDRDKMIAAHALASGLTLVTDNTKDFVDIPGLSLENWREPGDLNA